MAFLTAQQISRYYESYNSTDVIFTKEVIQTVGLQPKDIFLKHVGEKIPCVVYSASMTGAKIVANVKSDLFARIRATNNTVSLRFAFTQPDRQTPLSFFVNSKITGFNPYGQRNKALNFVTLDFPNRPPDDLIVLLGQLLETSTNSRKRREERVVVTPGNRAKLGLRSNDAIVYIQGVPRKCIIRDLSFSGARLIIPGTTKLLSDKPVSLSVDLEENNAVQIAGKIIRIEPVSGRDDIAAIAVLFTAETVPLAYKMRISDYLRVFGRNAPEEQVAGTNELEE